MSWLLTPAQINRLDKAQVEGRRAQLHMSGRQVAMNVSYTGGFLVMLASLAARHIPTILTGLKLVYFLLVLTKRLAEMDSIYTNMINAIEYRSVKAMPSI